MTVDFILPKNRITIENLLTDFPNEVSLFILNKNNFLNMKIAHTDLNLVLLK
jgi:hypothetical protein